MPAVRAAVAVSVVALLLLGGCDRSSKAPAAASPAARAQSPAPSSSEPFAELRALAELTGRHGGTRVAGGPGYAAATDLVEQRLRAAGWRVRRQPVRFPYFDERSPPRLALRGGRTFRAGTDINTMLYSGKGSVTGTVRPVRLRFGSETDSGCRRGDFAGLRRDEVALIGRGVCRAETKARHAAAAGAAAALIANDGRPGHRDAIPATLVAPGIDIPVLALSTDAGRALAKAAGRRVRVRVDAVSERRSADNLIADSPRPARRVVMAGAHLDSVGQGPGINDDGSGVAALLAAAERLRDVRGARLGFWAAEELGLYGSRRYVRELSRAERRAIRAYVNLDMVGSPHPKAFFYAGGAEVGAALGRALRRAGRRPVRTGTDEGSDHVPFMRAGIAVGGLFTGAGRPYDLCYHQACDTLDNVDREVLDDMTDAAVSTLRDLAD